MTKELQLLKRSHYLTNLLHSHFAELRHVHLHPHMMKLYHDDLPAWPSIEFSPVDAAITSRRPLMKRGFHPALLDEAQRKDQNQAIHLHTASLHRIPCRH